MISNFPFLYSPKCTVTPNWLFWWWTFFSAWHLNLTDLGIRKLPTFNSIFEINLETYLFIIASVASNLQAMHSSLPLYIYTENFSILQVPKTRPTLPVQSGIDIRIKRISRQYPVKHSHIILLFYRKAKHALIKLHVRYFFARMKHRKFFLNCQNQFRYHFYIIPYNTV